MKIVTISAGIILTITGIWCFAHPGATFMSVAFILGISMLLSGLLNVGVSIILFLRNVEQTLWQLAEGILTTILSVLILFDLLITNGIVIIFFGMWVLFSGVLRIMASLGIKRLKIAGWYWGIISGTLSIVAGIFAFVNPLATGLTMALIIGCAFILQGANGIVTGLQIRKSDKREVYNLSTEELAR